MSIHRVTVQHIRHLAAGPTLVDGARRDTLADTDDGIRLIPAEAGGLGRTLSEHVRADGGRIARELNKLLAGYDDTASE